MSLCSALDSQLEEFLLSNTIQSTSTGLGIHGLNLSTNNGLDLTCPSYEEGLNLSQQNSGGSGQYNYNEAVVLNLTQDHQQLSHSSGRQQMSMHHGMQQPQQQQQQQYQSFMSNSSLEVGLNLSLQKSYASQQHTQHQSDYYNQYDGASGYTFDVSIGNNTNQMEQQRNSPLNLEQRSSPLNLTSVQVSGRPNKGLSSYHYQTDFGFSSDANGSSFQQQQQQQQQQTVNYTYYSQPQQNQSAETVLYDQSNLFDEGQFFVEANDMMVGQPQHQQASSQTVNKIRLFCSSCCTEFSSTTDLNRHMERHQMEAMSGITNGMSQQPQPQQHQNQMPLIQQQQQQQSRITSCLNQQIESMGQNINKHQLNNQQQQPVPMNVLPHWSDSFPTSSMSATNVTLAPPVSLPTSLVVSNCTEATPCNTSDSPVQQQQLASTSNNSSVFSTTTITTGLKRKVLIPKAGPNLQTTPLEMSNNSTKKLNEPMEMCSDCSLMFPTGLDLKKHIDLAHQGRQGKLFQCSLCAQEFDEKSALKCHLDLHAQEKPFSCQKCGMHFTNQAGLKRHMKRIHEKSKMPYSCDECGKSFYERHDLSRHEKIHSIPKCGSCNKSLGPPSSKHVCKVKAAKDDPPENEELKCKICFTQLETKVAWGYHMWKHTKDPSYIQTADSSDIPVKKNIPEKVKVKKTSAKESLVTSQPPSKQQQQQQQQHQQQQPTNKKNLNPVPSTSAEKFVLSPSKIPEVLTYPRAPEAHATSYTQISQPLCLQTSRLVVEEPIKPLNMQVILNVNQ